MLRLLGIDFQHELKSKGSSALALHGFAMLCMLLDHTYHVLGGPTVLNVIGRIAFPIFLFLLVEGFRHTRNIRAYMVRLLVFAVISEIPFDLMLVQRPFYFRHQNVMWTMLICMLLLWSISKIRERWPDDSWGYVSLCIGLACIVAELCRVDYGLYGVLLCLLFYFATQPVFPKWMTACIEFVGLAGLTSVFYPEPTVQVLSLAVPIQLFCCLALPFIWSYNGEPGTRNRIVQIARYAFYPLHLLVLGLLALYFR